MSFAARALTHRSLRRRHKAGLALLVLLLVWGGLWGMAAYRLNKALDGWVASAQTEGLALSFSDRSTDGTPFTVHLHLKNFSIAFPNADHAKAGEAVLYMNLWDQSALSTKLKEKINGQIAGVPFTAEAFKIAFAKPENRPIDEMDPGFFLKTQTLGLSFQTEKDLALGNRMEKLSFDLRVMGPAPDFTDPVAVRTWNDASGVLEFDSLELNWGPLTLSAKGTVGLSNDLQPEGAFSGKVEGLDETVAQLVLAGTIQSKQESLLRSSISILAHPSGVMGSSEPILPISVQGGGLYLGPVRIMSVPKLEWPHRPDQESGKPSHSSSFSKVSSMAKAEER
ncbi:MAG: DUF2125 domain-containing protein [Bdellovibrionales bacterium]